MLSNISEQVIGLNTDPVSATVILQICDHARQLERELADLQHDMARTLANHSADLSSAPAVDRNAVLEELTPLTFELGSARAGLYSNDTAVVPWEAVKRALKDKP